MTQPTSQPENDRFADLWEKYEAERAAKTAFDERPAGGSHWLRRRSSWYGRYLEFCEAAHAAMPALRAEFERLRASDRDSAILLGEGWQAALRYAATGEADALATFRALAMERASEIAALRDELKRAKAKIDKLRSQKRRKTPLDKPARIGNIADRA